MREIKFRAWSKKENKMVYDVQNEYDTIRGLMFEGTDEEPGENSFSCYLDEESYKVMQFTGLKDKNGEEIYEGDILKVNREGVSGKYSIIEVVEFYNGNFSPFNECECTDSAHTVSYEVIGNIYENPELLEKV